MKMNLKTARVLSGQTQYDVRLKTGIHQSKISMIERGYIQPKKDEIKILADAVSVKPEELDFKGQGEKNG